MRDRIELELDALTVDSFETTGARPDPREGRPHEVAMTVWGCTAKPSYDNTLCGCTPVF